MDVGNLISGLSAFSKSNLYIWKFSIHIQLKPCWKDFECYLASMWNERNCVVVWMFFGIALLYDWNENWPLEKILILGKIESRRRKGVTEDEMVGWHHRLSGHVFEQRERVKEREGWHAAAHGVANSWTRLSNWTTKVSAPAIKFFLCSLLLRFYYLPVTFQEITTDQVCTAFCVVVLQCGLLREFNRNPRTFKLQTKKIHQIEAAIPIHYLKMLWAQI